MDGDGDPSWSKSIFTCRYLDTVEGPGRTGHGGVLERNPVNVSHPGETF